MSAKVMGAVFELDLKHAEKLVLLAMADHADQFGEHVFPSVGLVAWKTGYSERQVQRIIHELVKVGLLRVEHWPTPTRPFEYSIHTEKGKPLPPYFRHYSAGGDVLSPGAKSRNQNDSSSTEGATIENANVTLTVKEPSREPSPARGSAAPASTASPFPDLLPVDFTLTPERRAIAIEAGYGERETDLIFAAFVAQAGESRKRLHDWDARWRRWVIDECRMRPPGAAAKRSGGGRRRRDNGLSNEQILARIAEMDE